MLHVKYFIYWVSYIALNKNHKNRFLCYSFLMEKMSEDCSVNGHLNRYNVIYLC